MPRHNITDLATLLASLPPGACVLGIDPGRARIGIALSDANRRLAAPYAVLKRSRLVVNAGEIMSAATHEQAAGFVCGWPLEEDGSMGPAAQAARDWARALSEATGLPGALWDETLTTADALESLIAADVSRAKRAAVIDRVAAARMLQAALDSVRPG